MPMLAALQPTPITSLAAATSHVVITTRLAGVPTPGFLVDLTQQVRAHGAGDVTLSLDLRDLASADATADVIRNLAAQLGGLVEEGLRRVAIVSSERKVSLGIARMLQAYAESAGVDAMCFLDEQDAAHWLAADLH